MHATHTYTLATALTPLPQRPYVRIRVYVYVRTYHGSTYVRTYVRVRVRTMVRIAVRTGSIMLFHSFLIGKGHTC
jgi:hypothetical protein